MQVKDILVHLDSSEACTARLDAAIALAGKYSAHLTGLYIIPEPYVPSSPSMMHYPGLIEIIEQAEQSLADKTETRFKQAVENTGLSAEWRLDRYEVFKTFNRYAGCTDLVVVSQPDGDPIAISTAFVEHVVLGCGRPVLLIPRAGLSISDIGKRVLIAWNDSHEAARAVHDALPLLENAEAVEIVTVNTTATEAQQFAAGADEMCSHLAYHGIEATVASIDDNVLETSDAILAYAIGQHADLIVMGAYGHSRWRELVLGGMSRNMLRQLNIPVLMSH